MIFYKLVCNFLGKNGSINWDLKKYVNEQFYLPGLLHPLKNLEVEISFC